MLFSLLLLDNVYGGGVMLAGVLVCAALYLAVGLIPRRGRTRKGRRTVLLGLLCGEAVCDLAWFLLYFPGGEYRNYGIGGVYGALLWPLALFIIGAAVGGINAARTEEKT